MTVWLWTDISIAWLLSAIYWVNSFNQLNKLRLIRKKMSTRVGVRSLNSIDGRIPFPSLNAILILLVGNDKRLVKSIFNKVIQKKSSIFVKCSRYIRCMEIIVK